MRIDEFSRDALRGSHATIHELTSQTQELQERTKFMNDSRDFQNFESICSGTLSHVPCQLAVVPSTRSMLSRDQSLRSDTWNLSGTQANVFGHPRAVIDSSQTLSQGVLHSTNQSATGVNPCRRVQGDLLRKVKNNWRHNSNAEFCKKSIKH